MRHDVITTRTSPVDSCHCVSSRIGSHNPNAVKKKYMSLVWWQSCQLQNKTNNIKNQLNNPNKTRPDSHSFLEEPVYAKVKDFLRLDKTILNYGFVVFLFLIDCLLTPDILTREDAFWPLTLRENLVHGLGKWWAKTVFKNLKWLLVCSSWSKALKAGVSISRCSPPPKR